MGKYSIGDVWWVRFPYQDEEKEKHRPAIVIDEENIAILAMYVTSKNKDNPYSIAIKNWKETGLSKPSWARIDKIVKISERNMDRKIGELSREDLVRIMQLVAEILTGSFHEFSLIAIKNQEGKYLQVYDERWECWLFPYIRSGSDNKENVDEYVKRCFKIEAPTTYVTCAKHCKYSVSDEVYKIYNHKLYRVGLDTPAYGDLKGEFDINGMKCKWMSIKEMEQDETIMDKNDDVIAFIKTKCL
mgnify:CR=1 FL=1